MRSAADPPAALRGRISRAISLPDASIVAGTVLAFGIAVYLAVSLTRNATYVAAIWPANAIMLAGLLSCSSSFGRRMLLAGCVPVNAAVYMTMGDPVAVVLAFPVVNAAEVALAYYLLRYACDQNVEFTRAWTVAKFGLVCLIAPIAPSLTGAYVAAEVFGAPFIDALTTWYLSDSLGLLVLTPAILLIGAKPLPSEASPTTEAIIRHGLIVVAVSLVVFVQSSAPLLFLLIPVSVLVAFRLGPRYAAMTTLWLTVVSLTATYQDWGPAALMGDFAARLWGVQLFCLVNLLTSLAVAVEIADRDRLRSDLEKMSALASERHRQLNSALDAMSQGVCLFDRNDCIIVRNSQFLEIYGLAQDAVPPGTTLSELMAVCRASGAVPEHTDDAVDLNVDSDIEQELVGGRHIRISQRVLHDGGVICTYTDFTAEKRAEAALLHRALHDVLTGLPNRVLLVDRIDQALAAASRGVQVAVMLLDIDYFKSVNDNHGHAAGDALLNVVADRLRACVRATDTVARLGGDEFAIVLIDVESAANIRHVAERILEAARQPVLVENRSIRISMSIGVACPPHDGDTADEILKAADVALYKAKRNGRDNFAFFDAAEDAGVCSARRLECDLRRAVEERQFRVVYQPIVTGTSSAVVALEALVRWDHPELGTIAPSEFIPLAERNGLIGEIGDWVLEQACADATRLPSEIKISVNLSRVQISDAEFVSRVLAALERTGLEPQRLELEITETAIIEDEDGACRVLKALGDIGVSVAIDDFGVGQSALSCLRSLPIGRIKIDRSFVSDVGTDPKARSIFVAVASIAKSLGIKTTAEGIETEQQRIIAALAGCDQLQGYFLGRPDALEKLDFKQSKARVEDDKPSLDMAS